jgi:gamma-glutamylcyclotransferase (GGCT)/AIG2-like uncharacterized protein YtfP
MARIFLYGTLKRGGASHHFLVGQRYVDKARTAAEYRLYLLDGYPGLVPSPRDGRSIEGEIWEVEPACLARLDEWEGTEIGLFARAAVRLLPPYNQTGAEAYLYLKSVEGRADAGTRFDGPQPPA